jgi:hypothetical protein
MSRVRSWVAVLVIIRRRSRFHHDPLHRQYPRDFFCKMPASSIYLIAGLGVEGDELAGRTVQHRSRVAADPTQPNLRQVHLLHAELFDELREQGFDVQPGQLGENITTAGIDLLDLPRGTRLTVGVPSLLRGASPGPCRRAQCRGRTGQPASSVPGSETSPIPATGTS